MAVYGIREEPLSVQQPNPLRNYAALTIRRNSATAGTSPTGFGPSPQFGSPGSFERHEFSSTMARLEAASKPGRGPFRRHRRLQVFGNDWRQPGLAKARLKWTRDV